MNDPRDVGLPPLEAPPAFSSSPQALGEVRRRYTRRRQRRIVVAGGGMAAVIVALAVAFTPGGTTATLEQQQPAHPGGLAHTTPPALQPSVGADPGRSSTPPGAGGSGALNPSTPGATGAAASYQPSPGVGGAPAAQDSTEVTRDRWNMSGQQYCRQLEKGWQALGWCFEAEYPATFIAGRVTSMTISLCRNSSVGGQVRFPSAQQGVWSISHGNTRLWSSTEQPSRFHAGEVVNLPSLACLRWRVDWHVTTHGQPLPAGDYVLAWSTGADVRDAQGAGYHDSDVVHVR